MTNASSSLQQQDPDLPTGALLDEAAFTVPTKYWQRLENGRIQCDLCPRHCSLGEGQRGMCFVRARQNDAIVLTTWGRSSGFCIDPVEKKPLNHFLPGTPVLSFGTAGCNLQCSFCQNWSISRSRQTDTLADAAEPALVARAAEATGCRSVAFTYNDPVIFLEYAIDIAKECRARGVKTVAVTAGYICPEPRREFFAHMDAANVDLKAFSEDFYRQETKSERNKVLDSLEYIVRETDCWLEITTLLIPDRNDSPAEIRALSGWVREALGPDVPLHFSAFHPDHRMTDRGRTPARTLFKARQIARGEGINHVYVGNIHDPGRESSWCSQCGTRLIERNRYRLGVWNLDEQGCCVTCKTPLPGHFEPRPGTWGAKRQPVSLERYREETAYHKE